MKRKVKVATALSVFGAFLGCAQISPPSGPAQPQAARGTADKMPVKVAAGQPTPKGASGAEVLFSVGRYAHGAGQLEVAAQRYTQALEMDPTHVGALNAMAVIHAQADRTDAALQLFRRAMQLAPKAAHLHNNTGYALLRAGRLEEARAELKQARDLDPSSLQVAQNIELLPKEEGLRATALARAALEKAAGPEVSALQLVAVAQNVYELRMPAPPAAQQSAALPAAAPVPAVAAAAAPSVAALAQAPAAPAVQPVVVSAAPAAIAAVAAPVVVVQAPAAPKAPAAQVATVPVPVVQVAAAPAAQAAASPVAATPVAGVVPVTPAVAVAPAVPVAVVAKVAVPSVKAEPMVIRPVAMPAGLATAQTLRGVRLEVSNGVGITNLARRTADRLAPTGVITARLTNARPFRQAKTEIQFVAGQDLSAQALQARLPVTAITVAAGKLDRGVQIRLVLGRDAAGRAIAAWLDTEAVRLAAAPEPQGGGWALL